MPDFAGVTPVESLEDISMTFIWNDGTKKTRRVTDPPATVVIAEAEELVERMSAISNAGLIKYKSNGIVREIAINNATIYDESHGISDDLILSYQKEDTLDTREIRIPAPGAEYFTGGIYLIPAEDTADTANQVVYNLLVAINAVINKGLTSGALWGFNGGYLSTATAQERRKVPQENAVLEPPPGSPAEAPGDDESPPA